MAKPELHHFAFGPNDFVNAVDTGLPGLWAVVCNGTVMVARRGGVWYEPRGNEAQAAADALSLSLDGKYVCVDGHAVEDICGQCEKNIRDCQCQEEAEDEEPEVRCPQCKGIYVLNSLIHKNSSKFLLTETRESSTLNT